MLTFNLKKEWFEKIKSGEKTHEYRELTDYWQRRLQLAISRSKVPDFSNPCCFKLGYPPKNDKTRTLYAKIIAIKTLQSGINTDLKINKPVFDIEFELIKE